MGDHRKTYLLNRLVIIDACSMGYTRIQAQHVRREAEQSIWEHAWQSSLAHRYNRMPFIQTAVYKGKIKQ
jgi:hypothetical protein